MVPTSDQTLAALSGPVHTTDQTSRLQPQGCPHRPDLRGRAYMECSPNYQHSKALNRYGQYGQYGQLSSPNGSSRPDLRSMVGTVGTGGMFHANHRRLRPFSIVREVHSHCPRRVLPGLADCGLASAQCSCMFQVPSLVPLEHGGSA